MPVDQEGEFDPFEGEGGGEVGGGGENPATPEPIQELQQRVLTRAKLSRFLPNLEAVKAFEDLSRDVSQTLPGQIETAVLIATNHTFNESLALHAYL